MKNEVQNKLLNYEAIPPKEVWDHIALELDESFLSYNFPNKLNTIEAEPPQHVWNVIAASLTGTEATLPSYADKLKTATVIPPTQAWENIKNSLDANEKVAPMKHRSLFPILKYTAAAMIAGALIFGGLKLLQQKKQNTNSEIVSNNEPASTPVAATTIEPQTATALADTDENNAMAIAQERRNNEALEASKRTYAKLEETSFSRLKEIATAYHFTSSIEASDYPNAIDKEDQPNRYITVMTPDCNVVRMSKKLEDLSCCISGESVDKNCLLQLDKWRKQAAAAAAIRPANFMGIMDMIDALDND